MNYLTIESVSGEAQDKVKQNLKFKSGKFVWRVKFTAPLDPSTVSNKFSRTAFKNFHSIRDGRKLY